MRQPTHEAGDGTQEEYRTVFQGYDKWLLIIVILILTFGVGYIVRKELEKNIAIKTTSTEPVLESNEVIMRVLTGKYMIRESYDEKVHKDPFYVYDISILRSVPYDSLRKIVNSVPHIKGAMRDTLNKYQIPFTYRKM